MQGHFSRAEENLRTSLVFLRRFTQRPVIQPKDKFHGSVSNSNQTPHSDPYSSNSQHDRHASKFANLSLSELKSATLNVFLHLARLYLDGDRVRSAINVLEVLHASDLPRAKQGLVHLLLATAYMKRRRYVKAERIMCNMEIAAGLSNLNGGSVLRKTRGMAVSTLTLGADILTSS